MRNITLLNPEIAQEIFKANGWDNQSNYFIEIEGSTRNTLCNASVSCAQLSGEKLNIGFVEKYTISLDEFGHEIILELKAIENLGVLLTINQAPYFLRVFRTSPENEIKAPYPQSWRAK